MLQQIILYAVLLIAAIGAIVGWTNSKKGAEWGQPMTIVCAIVAICMGLWLAYRNSSPSAGRSAAMARENAYREAKVNVLAAKVKELLGDKKAVVIVDPNVDITKDVEMLLWKSLFNLSDEDFLKPEPPKAPAGADPEMAMMEPMDEWFIEPMFKKLVEGKQFDFIIFTTSLPRGLKYVKGQFTAPYMKDKKIVLASGNLFNCAPLLHSGVAVAAITSSPSAVYDDKPAPKETQAAFDKRYILISKDNADAMVKANPEIFGIEKKD
ncbi:MAG: hypothetical protein IKS20_03945 [Victivallales bacterium]|nr:hypothetical protein [Victivallales bacterium]